MKKLSTEVAEITHKAINLFSTDVKLAKHIAGVLHSSKAQIPETASAEERAQLLRGNENMLDSRDIKLSKPRLTKLREMLAANPTTQPGEIPASKPATQPKNDDRIPFMGMSGERRTW